MSNLFLENPQLFDELLGECLKLRISKITRQNYFVLSNFRWNLISDRMHQLVKELSGVILSFLSIMSFSGYLQLLLLLAVSFEWHSEREQLCGTVGIVL